MTEIKPIKCVEYHCKQSKCENVGKLPIRSIILGPSGSGKTVLLTNMILNIYRNCFERIYIFSPSINVDSTWIPVKEYIEKDLQVFETEDERFYYDNWDEEALQMILSRQKKLIEHMKSKGMKKMYNILVVVDDLADDPRAVRNSKLLDSLFLRGRHIFCSTFVSTQQYHAINPKIRINATDLYVFRLRNKKDLAAFIEETSAIVDKKTLMKLYESCTSEPFSFLYVKLTSKKLDDMFLCNFNKQVKFKRTSNE